MSQLTSEQIAVVAAVIAFEGAKKRIPVGQRPGVTYFSMYDTWLFDATLDSKVCDLCRYYEEWGEIRGDLLRTEFPFLVILDENTIGGPGVGGDGLVHPNCRCRLIRKIG